MGLFINSISSLANPVLAQKAKGFFKLLYTTPYHPPDSWARGAATQRGKKASSFAWLDLIATEKDVPGSDTQDIVKDATMSPGVQLDAAGNINHAPNDPISIKSANAPAPGNKSAINYRLYVLTPQVAYSNGRLTHQP